MGLRVIKSANVMVVTTAARSVVIIAGAVSLLGFQALRQLVMSISIIENNLDGPCKQFNYAHFCSHFCSHFILTGSLTERSKLAPPEDIFTLELLENIRNLALATLYPEEFGKIFRNIPSAD